MKSMFGLIASTLLFAGSAYALDQASAVESLRGFLDLRGPVLYEGHDEVGECRVMIYSSTDADASRVYLEGTFQYATGPVLGFAINFFLSSSIDESQIGSFQMDAHSVSASAVYAAQSGELAIGLGVEKREDASLGSIHYDYRSGTETSVTRSCSDLRKLL